MQKYTFTMSETDVYRAVFTANSFEEAQDQLRKVNTCEIDYTDLPNFEKFGRDYEQLIEFDTLKEEN